jgi:hypothetical protein
MSKRRFAVVAAALVFVVAIPIPATHCPHWDVTVVDQSGRPVPGVTVRLSYTNYSAEDEHHQMDRTTDDSGQVAFPKETLWASSLRRVFYTVLSARADVHASFGPSASVMAFGRGLEGEDVDPTRDILVFWHGRPSRMESRIVMKQVTFR